MTSCQAFVGYCSALIDSTLHLCTLGQLRDGKIKSSERRVPDGKIKSSPYSITERRVPELVSVLGSQPAGDVNHKPGGRLPQLSARPAVTPATLKSALLPILLLGEQRHNGCEQFA